VVLNVAAMKRALDRYPAGQRKPVLVAVSRRSGV
jgi:hypothetical protein